MKAPQHFEYRGFYCQIYPHVRVTIRQYPEECIFRDRSEEIQNLEKLLSNSVYKVELRNWLGVLTAYEDLFIAPLLSDPSPDEPFSVAFEVAEQAFSVRHFARRIYLSLIQRRLTKWVDVSLFMAMRGLDKQFRDTLIELGGASGASQFSELLGSLKRPANVLLIDLIRQLACIDSANFTERFRILLKTICQLQLIQKVSGKSDTIYPIIFQQNKGQQFLSTFLVLNNFAMKCPLFMPLCTDLERQQWLKLESVALNVMKSNPDFLQVYIALQEAFTQIASLRLV
jgi:hypothetical protein